jgi:hypothetical protein
MRALTAIAACVVTGVVGVAAQQAPRPATPPKKPAPASPTASGASAAGPLLAGQVFKNVQVLKDVPVDDFLPLMGVMTASVGGDCSTCHAAAGTDLVVWEADTPLKRRARQMSAMVVALNKDSFGGRTVVTCWTCHRGRSVPVQTPTLDQVYGTPDLSPEDLVMATAAGLPRPETIVDRYLTALGGVQKLSAITSYTATGTSQGFRGFGGGGAVQIYAKAPDQRSMIIEYKAQGRDATVRSYDGQTGWIKTPLNVLGQYQLGGSELDGARLDAQLTFPGQLKQVLTRLRTLDTAEIDGKEMDVIQGNGPRNLFATLYFDKATGLLQRLVRFGTSPIGRLPTQLEFDDYRDVNGVKLPFKVNFIWLDGRDSIQLDAITLNAPVDPAKFDKPTALEKRK